MKIGVRIVGATELRREIETASRRVVPEAEQNVRKASEVVVGAALRQFKGSRTRALYEISGGKRIARKPPRPVTSPPDKLGVWEGTYRRAITYDVSRRGKQVESEVGPVGIAYARRHEFGILGMPQRQVITPAVEETKDRVFGLIARTFEVLP